VRSLQRSFLITAIGGGALAVAAVLILKERFDFFLDLFDSTPVSQARVIVTPHQPIVLAASDVRSKSLGKTVQRIDVVDIVGAAQAWIDGDATSSDSIEIAEGSTIDVQQPSSNQIALLVKAKDGTVETLTLNASDTGAGLQLIHTPETGDSTIETVVDRFGVTSIYNVTPVKLDVLGKQATFYLFEN
jgi:hypothetical protein